MSPLRIVIVTAFLLFSAGCGNTHQPDAERSKPMPALTSSSPSPSPKPTAADEYDTAQRLVGGLNEAGIACLNWERTENPIGAEERGSCYVGTEEVVVSIYGSHKDAAADPDAKAEILRGVSDVDMVVGGNWTLSCDSEALCTEIASRFGGEQTHIPA